MSRKRRIFGAAFKAKVAMAACRGEKTTAQLAAEFGVHSKIEGNRARDKRVNKSLKDSGWKVIRIWESSLSAEHLVARRLANRLSPKLVHELRK